MKIAAKSGNNQAFQLVTKKVGRYTFSALEQYALIKAAIEGVNDKILYHVLT